MSILVASGPEFAAFQEAALECFGALARDCGSQLVEVEPWIFGFRTKYAVLTIGGYSGHHPSLCVKLRPSDGGGAVKVMDGGDIGLANIELFVTGAMSPVFTIKHTWNSESIVREVRELAAKTREIAMPFIAFPSGDWQGVRAQIARRTEEVIRNPPWKRRRG